MVLEAPHRRFHAVQRGAALGQGTPPRSDRVAHAAAELLAAARIGAGAAVHDQRGDTACHGSAPIAIMPG